MAAINFGGMVIHTWPTFTLTGSIDPDAGTYSNVKINVNSGAKFNFDLVLRLYYGSANNISSAVMAKELYHCIRPALNGTSSPTLNGTFTPIPSDKAIFVAMMCMVCSNNTVVEGTEYDHPCDIAWSEGKGDTRYTDVGPYPSKNKVILSYDLGDDYEGRYYTAAFYMVRDEVSIDTYSPGTLTVSGSRSGSTITANAVYTNNGCPKYWGGATAATDRVTGSGGNNKKVLLKLFKGSTQVGGDKLVSSSGNGTAVSTSWGASDGVDLTTAYTVRAYIVEQRDSTGATGLLTASANVGAGTAAAGTLTVSATRTGTGTGITATAQYTKVDAYAYWAADSESSSSTAATSGRILLRLYKAGTTTQVGSAKTPTTNGAGNNSTDSWTGVESTTGYFVTAAIVEQLDSAGTKKNPLFASANVDAYAAPGSIKVEAARDGDHITIKGTYSGDATYWAGRSTGTTKNSSNTNKVMLILVPKGGSYTSSTTYNTVANGGSWNATADPYTAYDCYATCCENIGGSNVTLVTDGPVTIEAEAVPVDPTYCTGMNAIITGTTISLQPVFKFGTFTTVEWTAKLGRIITSGTNSTWVKFELLANQTTYTIVFHGLNSKAVNTDPNATDSAGRKLEVTTDPTLLAFAAADIQYDCMTYGCSVTQFQLGRNSFEGRLFQIQGAHGETYHMLTQCGEKGYAGFCRARTGSSVANTNTGTVSISGNTIKVIGLKPSSSYRLYIYLTDCKDFNGDFDAVNYIDFTTEAVAVAGTFQARVTGKSVTITPNITRWNNSESVAWRAYIRTNSVTGTVVKQITGVCNRTSLMPYGTSGLNNGTKYYITFEAFDELNNPLPVDPIEIVTYGINLTLGTPYTRSIRGNSIKYTEGERASSTVQDSSRGSAVKYYVTTRPSGANPGNVIIDATTVNCRRTNPNIFDTDPITALNPVTQYRMIAFIEGVEYEGANDTIVYADFTTMRAPANLAVTTQATGETIRVTPTWTASNSPNNEVLVSVALYSHGVLLEVKTTVISNTDLWFTGLERGTEHIIVFVGEDNEGNTMDDFFTYATGVTGVTTETTYKLTFSNQSKSTRSAKWTCTSNRALPTGKVIEYQVLENESIKMDWTGTMTSGSTRSYTNFHMTTPYCIRVRIQDMYDQDGAHDTVEEYFDITMTLTLEFDDYTPHVLILDTRWQALADGNPYDKDPISNIPIAFIPSKIEIWPVRKGKGTIGVNYGTYYPNRYRYFAGLTGGRQYHIVMWVTDGINEATAEIELWTLIELIRIYSEHDRRWYRALPYVYTNHAHIEGEDEEIKHWWPSPCYIYSRNAWRHTQPE